MASVSKIEPIKQLILETLKTDPTVKYEILGWVTEQFVPKVDLNKVLEEIRISREYSEKRFEAVDKRFEAVDKRFEAVDKRFEAINKRFEAVDKRFEEQAAEIKALREDTNKRFDEQREYMDNRFNAVDKHFEEQDKTIKKIDNKLGALGSRWGIMAESAFREGLISIVEDIFDGNIEKWRTFDETGIVYGHSCEVELDIVISNGKLIAGEIKSSVNKSEVAAFKRIVQLYEKETNNKPDRAVIITPFVDDKAKELADKLGIEIFIE